MNWVCPKCREPIDETFDTCWQCGTSRGGTPDATFQHADDFEPTIPTERPQFRLKTLLIVSVAGCLLFAFCGGVVNDSLSPLAMIAGPAAMAFLALYFFSWLITRRVTKLQRRIRDDLHAAQERKPADH
jgi:hypothetical protein